MRPLSVLLRDFVDAGSIESLVGVEEMLDDRTLITRSGELVTILRARGPDPECLAPDQLESVVTRFVHALGCLGEEFRISHYRFKRPHPELPRAVHVDEVLRQAEVNRADYLTARQSTLFTFETYVTVTYRGWRRPERRPQRNSGRERRIWSWIKQCASTQATAEGLNGALDVARRRLQETVDALIVQAGDALPLTLTSVEESFSFLRRLLNYSPEKVDGVRLSPHHRLSSQLADSSLDCYADHLRLGDRYVQVLTLKLLPPQTMAHLLRDLDRIAAPTILVTEFQPVDRAKARGLIQSRQRHFYGARTSLRSHLASPSDAARASPLIDSAADSVVNELSSCLADIEVNGKTLGTCSLTIIVYGESLEIVRRAAAECFKVFAGHDARVVEERYNLLNAWSAAIPGNDSHNLRRFWLFDRNYADMAPLFEPNGGEAFNAHLKTPHLAVFETDVGAPFHFNLHHGDIAHTLILGPTGSGKSFLLNFIITWLKKYDPAIFILDLGGSYQALTKLFKGGYTSLARQSRGSINPFASDPTPEHLHFLALLCRVFIESSGYSMTPSDEKDLHAQIANVYCLEAPERRLRTLAQLVNRNLRAHLSKWVGGGIYGDWFDNETDTVSLETFQTLDFEGLSDYPQVLEALIFYILHRVSDQLTAPAFAKRLKILVLDEAWRFLRHPAIRVYVIEALKTWRKQNAAVLLATQSIDDLTNSEILSVVVESCATKLFLANPNVNRDQYRELFQLNQTEIERIARLTPKRQFLMKRPDLAKVLALDVDRKSYWLYTNSPTENAQRQEAFAAHGVAEGLEILARRTS